MDTNQHGFFNRRASDAQSGGEQLEFDWNEAQPFPEILTLREFVAQMEREYGHSQSHDALRAAMGEPL